MEQKNFFNEIILDMGCIRKNIPYKKQVVDDSVILEKIKQIEDREQVDRDGRTLLINAAFYGRVSVVEFLLQSGVNVDAKDNNGYTALHAAVQEKYVDVIKMLLDYGADIHSRDIFGNPPIFRTNLSTPKEVFQTLLCYGADPNEKNNFGISVIDIFKAYPDILEYFNQ